MADNTAASTPAPRTLIRLPDPAPRGQVIEVQATIAHPMTVGLGWAGDGTTTPRHIITRFECRLDGQLVFAADLYQAIAANPYLAFALKAEASGRLELLWEGDHGFSHRQSVALNVA